MFKFVALLALFAVADATNYAYQTVHTPVYTQQYHQTVPVVQHQTPVVYHQTPTVYQQTVPVVSKTYQTVQSPVVYKQQYQQQYYPVTAAKTYQTVPAAVSTYGHNTYQTVPVSTYKQAYTPYTQYQYTAPAVVYSAQTVHKPVEQHGYQVTY